ncbi:MAG: hypothetical protein V4739_18195 [Pseudomonadota bacterium]
MSLSSRVPMLLVMCLAGATPVAVVAADPVEAPAARASSMPMPTPVPTPVPEAAAGDRKVLSAQALDACEAAVTDSLNTLRGPGVQRIEFNRSQPVVIARQDEEVPLKGSGRYANRSAKGAAVPFTYACNYNVRTGKTNGVVISDSQAATAGRSATAGDGAGDGRPRQPDLARLSPEACEAAVAAALKNRHPRVGRIAFDAQSRQLKASATPERTLLQGQGGVQRAPGMAAAAFTYQCEFYDRSGALVDTQVTD